jgi:hypothetical protein
MENIDLYRGETYTDVFLWEIDPIVYKPITAATQTAPVRITVTGHGMPNGWFGAITNVKGMTELNAEANNIGVKDYHQITYIDANTVDVNDINAAGFKPYISGGYIQYNTPKNLTGISARMSIKARQGEKSMLICSVGGVAGSVKPTAAGVDGGVTWAAPVSLIDLKKPATKEWVAGATYVSGDVIDTKTLFFLTEGNGRIIVDDATKTIVRTISAADIALFSWKTAWYDLEAYSNDIVPIVTKLASGKITVHDEVTT